MTEYITKERAIDEVWDAFMINDDPELGRVIEENIERLPPADVVEVVRCEDCVNCLPESECYMFQYTTGEKMELYEIVEHRKKLVCRIYNMTVWPRFYCGSGERWEDVMNG